MSTNQSPKPGTEAPTPAPELTPEQAQQEAHKAFSDSIMQALMTAQKQRQEQEIRDLFVDNATTVILENVASALASEVERLYKTRQTIGLDVRNNNSLLDTLMAGLDTVDYRQLQLLSHHFRSGCALRRAARTQVR